MAKYEYSNGSTAWYKNNQLHRDDDLPAVIWKDGTQIWYQYGVLHRNNGPAIIWPDGSQEYWINGGKVTSKVNWMKAGF